LKQVEKQVFGELCCPALQQVFGELSCPALQQVFGELSCPALQQVQMNFIFSDNVDHCVYPKMSKSPKQQPNCLKRTATSICLIVLYGVLCDVSDYIVTISYHRST
jgi:hypothetical protein